MQNEISHSTGWCLARMAAIASTLVLTGCMELHETIRPTATTNASSIRLSDAKPLDDMEDEDVQVTLTDKLYPPDTTQPVYFGEADAFDSDSGDGDPPIAAVPLIATRSGSVWKAISLDGPGLANAGWKYVAAGPSRREMWGVLDTSAGDSAPDCAVAHSTDGAQTFSLRTFHKPTRLAVVDDFSMTRAGQGKLTLSLDTDSGMNKAGYYVYVTTDDGKTWSAKPQFEPDAMVRADTVSDDEQPKPAEKPVWVLFNPHRKMSKVSLEKSHATPRR